MACGTNQRKLDRVDAFIEGAGVLNKNADAVERHQRVVGIGLCLAGDILRSLLGLFGKRHHAASRIAQGSPRLLNSILRGRKGFYRVGCLGDPAGEFGFLACGKSKRVELGLGRIESADSLVDPFGILADEILDDRAFGLVGADQHLRRIHRLGYGASQAPHAPNAHDRHKHDRYEQ